MSEDNQMVIDSEPEDQELAPVDLPLTSIFAAEPYNLSDFEVEKDGFVARADDNRLRYQGYPEDDMLQWQGQQDEMVHLRALHPELGLWRMDEQRDAYLAIMEAKNDVIVAIRPGGGKTALVATVARASPGMVVVVVPLLELRNQWADVMAKYGLPAVIFASAREFDLDPDLHTRSIANQTKVVIVSGDVCAHQPFIDAMVKLGKTRLFTRIVIDEFHTCYLDQDFRAALALVYAARSGLPVQLITLSGTVPTALVEEATKMLCLVTPQVIRSTITRLNIRYSLWPSVKNNAELKQRIQQILDSDEWSSFVYDTTYKAEEDHYTNDKAFYESNDKWIIFVPFLDTGKFLADTFGLPFYHGSNERTKDTVAPLTTEERRGILERWQAEGGGIVGTSAMGAGIDMRYVSGIIMAGSPMDACTFVQEVDRAGREDRRALAAIIPDRAPAKRTGRVAKKLLLKERGLPDIAGYATIEKLHDGMTECIRGVLTEHFDDTIRTCSMLAIDDRIRLFEPCSGV
ncbi:P-loop containing nucleoside triphosphate hydrolase protein [Cylindrobasidium torrendii FP15055 ss-10]|uniref:DNA 3'-5' helicase n=1 Tax=Cylindrobasidium torrendii FP15055 ss-10 TaxID=1314674 RepID=A0A0D7ASE4_9AGAR|nr:P-loop containing nucleoside triphosphate hydrolase protein [Cylindrobasidium torrendii FP15055 ss-10]